jgi:hypothetical protein
MKINELAVRHMWNNDLGSRIREVIDSNFCGDTKALNILKSIEREYYDSDDVIGREKMAKDRISKELPKEFVMYLLRFE